MYTRRQNCASRWKFQLTLLPSMLLLCLMQYNNHFVDHSLILLTFPRCHVWMMSSNSMSSIDMKSLNIAVSLYICIYIFHLWPTFCTHCFPPPCSNSFTTGSVSQWVAGDMLLRRSNPSPVLPLVPWQFDEYEPSPKETRPLSHTAGEKSPLYPPSSSIPLSPALTLHLNSKVRLFISLPHPIKGAWYKRMKLDFLPACWRIRAEVEAAVSDVCEPRWSSSRCKDKIGGQPTL